MLEGSESVFLFLSSIFFVMHRLITKKKESAVIISREKRSPDPEADYSREKGAFDKLFYNEKEANINIHPDLYGDITQDQDWYNVENIWKSRILIQNTLQGNVIMYYDIYKLAFVYYSDMQISHKWLNYCAMKYVRIFYCRDFFLDDSFLPTSFENPFNQKKSKEDKEDCKKKEDKKKKMDIDFQSDVFLKRKGNPKKNIEIIQRTELAEKCVNHFRYMGKLANYSFLQIPVKSEKTTKKYNYIDFKKDVHSRNRGKWV